VYAVSEAGRLVYARGSAERLERRLVWADRRGNIEPLPAPLRRYQSAQLSPNNRLAALDVASAIWIYDFVRSTLTPLTTGGPSQAPVWAPDGTHVVYRGTRSGLRNLFWKAVDDTSPEERLTKDEGLETPGSFSPRGTLLAFSRSAPVTDADIWVMPMAGDRKPRSVIAKEGRQTSPQFSPDGQWLAYGSTESGREEVYVQPYPGLDRRVPISTDGGTEPRWSRNGRELFYRNADKFMAVDVNTQPTFSAGSPRLLFQGRGVPGSTSATGFDVSNDGQKFLMFESVESQPRVTQIEVVMNWLEELKRFVPVTR
jgi:dipeptidyl aminopeptidase/acylaminoacyl peptidase